jgi:hypothetical protein
MKAFVTNAAIAAALLGLGAIAFAADDATKKTPTTPTATTATLVCRPAITGEKAGATTVTNVALVCKKVDMDGMMGMRAKMSSMPGGDPIWLQMFQQFQVDQNGIPG